MNTASHKIPDVAPLHLVKLVEQYPVLGQAYSKALAGLERFTLSNAEFLDAIFSEPDASPWVTGFPGDPNNGRWEGLAVTGNTLPWIVKPSHNNFFCISTFKIGNDGKENRRKENFYECYVIILDDLGTKIELETLAQLPPSYVIETSPRNYQAGYILSSPVDKADIVENVINALIGKGLSDPGMKGVTRYGRLPVGVNAKKQHVEKLGAPFVQKLHEWRPDRRYTTDEIIEGFELDSTPPPAQAIRMPLPVNGSADNYVIEELKKRGLYKGPGSNPGSHNITCPWVDEHTGGIDSGTGYFEPSTEYPEGGFHCFHGHCEKRSLKDLLVFLGIKDLLTRETASTIRQSEKRKLVVVSAADLQKMKTKRPESILSPWLCSQSLSMIYSWRGTGKTWVALNIAYAVATGGSFLRWKAEQPIKVLYIDGEMPAYSLKERLEKIAGVMPHPEILRILTPDFQPSGIPDLSNGQGQEEFESVIEADTKLIIVDNISALCRTGKENESESWMPVQEWALRMRAKGISVLFIHHAGKGGGQRGSSKREDILDTVINLKRPMDYKQDQGACFEVHFEKARHIHGDETNPFLARLETDPNERSIWTMKDLEGSNYEKVIELTGAGLKQAEIAHELGINRSTVHRHISKAIADGRLNGKGKKMLHDAPPRECNNATKDPAMRGDEPTPKILDVAVQQQGATAMQQ